MVSPPPTMVIPLQPDEHGAIRVSGTRVTLDTIIARHHQGDSPEAIHEGFPTVPVTDIYAVIAYYLANQVEIDAYLAHREEAAERLRQEVEANRTPEQQAAHDRLLARVEAHRRSTSD